MKLWLILLALLIGAPASAHDSWINTGGLRNAAGELCCGDGDCFEIPSENVRATERGYQIFGVQVVNAKNTPFTELVPYSEAQPSPDGLYWRCKRPDGSRRCFFAPPPSM